MFLFYYIWGFFAYIIYYVFPILERLFLIKNNPHSLRKRTFAFISYFEKLFLVLFYRKGWFENSIANLYRKKDIIEYRRNNYPIINWFHLYFNKMDYSLLNLKLLVKQYKYFTKSKLYSKKINFILKNCFNNSKLNFLNFLIIFIIFFDKYYNSYSYPIFKKYNNLNTIKLNRIFNLFLLNSKKKLKIFDLNKWDDWYSYNFDSNILIFYKTFDKPTRRDVNNMKEFKLKKLFKWIGVVFKYKKRYKFIIEFFGKKFKGILYFRFNINTFFKIKINKDFFNLLKNYYTVKFSESSVSKYINPNSLKNYNILYLRKNRIFNKGRYSRNRQLYRTGVYWCLWLNIIMVYGLYFMFYRFSFNFGYIWWGILILAYSTIFSRIVKYNYYNIYYVYKEFNNLSKWYGYLFLNLIDYIENKLFKYINTINIYNFIISYRKNIFGFIFNNYYKYFIYFFKKWMFKKQRIKMIFIWQGMKEKDNSFLRYKTIIHFLKETYRLFTTW